VVRAGAGADLVHPANLGPAAMLALLAGDPDLARVLQWPVSIGAVVVTFLAARRVADPVASLAVAATASLVTLPVTWYHYPAALLPFGVAALGRGGRGAWVVAAFVLVNVALVPLPLAWIGIGALLWATRGRD
jgi:hypothetical protein